MRWVVISENAPARLHAALESAKTFLPCTMPHILTPAPLGTGYDVVSGRFRANWTVWVDFRDCLLGLVSKPKTNGTLEAMTLITTDTTMLCTPGVLNNAWKALQDPNMLGFSLNLPPPPDSVGPTEHFVGGIAQHHVWCWHGLSGPHGRSFSFGTVYRTSDILGPMARNPWNSPSSLVQAACGDATLRRRTRMACLSTPAAVEIQWDPRGETERYLNGQVIDVAKLRPSQPAVWKPYQEEENGLRDETRPRKSLAQQTQNR